MNTQLLKKIQLKTPGFFLIATSFWVLSCRSTDNTISDGSGQAFVKINLQRTDLAESDILPKSASAGKTNNYSVETVSEQKQVIPFDSQNEIVATLVPEVSRRNILQAAINPIAAGPVELKTGIQYRVVVYDNNGAYKTDKVFSYKTNDQNTQDGIKLDAGSSYNFVAYSVNSATDVPVLPTGNTFSNAVLTGVKGDLMDFRVLNKTLTPDKNVLDVVLKHRFSQITTKIDATDVGNITNVAASFSPVNTSADLTIANGNLKYNTPVATASVDFTGNSNNAIFTSNPTILISDNTSTGQLNISSITVGGITKNNLTVGNLTFTPGVRYNLNVKLNPIPDLYTVITIGSNANYIQNGIPMIGTEPTNGGSGTGGAGLDATNSKLALVIQDLLGLPDTSKIEFLGLNPGNANAKIGLQKIFSQTAADNKRRNVVFIYTGYNANTQTNTNAINAIITTGYLNKGKIYFASADEDSWTSLSYFGTSTSYSKSNSYLPNYTITGSDLVETGETFPAKYGNTTSSGLISSQWYGNSLVPPVNAKIISSITASSTATTVGRPIIFKDNNYGGKLWVFGDTDAYWQYSNATSSSFKALPVLSNTCSGTGRDIFTCNMFNYVLDKNLKVKWSRL